MTDLEYHPLANLFPLIEGEDFDEFCAGIKADGILHDKIVLLDGLILDGRNRYRACLATGVTMHFETFNANVHGDPLKYVIGKNLHRRHLSESQRAMVAAGIATMRQGERTDLPSIEGRSRAVSQGDAAKMVNVGVASVERATEVRDHGAPELVEAVKAGEVTVSAAVEIVRALPVEDQRKLLADVAEAPDTKKAFSGVVKDLRRKKQDEKKDRRTVKEAELGARQLALPDRKFGVILADPEWPFEVWSEDTGQDRAAKNHYPTSPIEEIMARPVASIAADDAVLLLWATAPKLPDALRVMEAWGFAYVTHAIWVKDRIGTGYWFRNNHEILLLGKRGDPPKPADGTQWHSALAAPRGAHSEKPDWQYHIAETYFPTLPKIELNARRARPGWDAWGLEAPDNASESGASIIGLGEGSSLPPDVGVDVADEPFDPETGEIIDLGRTAVFETEAAVGFAAEGSTLTIGITNEAAENAEAGGPPREGGAPPQAPIPVSAASPVSDDEPIPSFLRAGTPENAWAKRGEGAS